MEVSKLKLDISSSSSANASEDRKSTFGSRNINGGSSGRRTATTASGS